MDSTTGSDVPVVSTLVAYELNYHLVKNELLRSDLETKCRLVQALRWVSFREVSMNFAMARISPAVSGFNQSPHISILCYSRVGWSKALTAKVSLESRWEFAQIENTLRWTMSGVSSPFQQLTKCGSLERRHSTLMAFISHDLLGCFKRQSEYATR